VAVCTVTYSAEVARSAAHAFFWRKFKTPEGVLYLISLPLVLASVFLIYLYEGPNWAVGAFGLLLVMNVMLQITAYFSVPRALVRRLTDPARRTLTIETLSDGFKAEAARSTTLLPWANLRYIWFYKDFILLVPPFPVLRATFVVVPTNGMTPEVMRDFETASQTRRSSNKRWSGRDA
jgi:hypothetical protein